MRWYLNNLLRVRIFVGMCARVKSGRTLRISLMLSSSSWLKFCVFFSNVLCSEPVSVLADLPHYAAQVVDEANCSAVLAQLQIICVRKHYDQTLLPVCQILLRIISSIAYTKTPHLTELFQPICSQFSWLPFSAMIFCSRHLE